MQPVQLENDPTTLVRDIESYQDIKWIVWVGNDKKEFDNWHSAYEYFLDEMKYWLGYYTAQKEEAEERGLTWTAEHYGGFLRDLERWTDYLQSVENKPQGINFIGGNRKLSINTRKQ